MPWATLGIVAIAVGLIVWSIASARSAGKARQKLKDSQGDRDDARKKLEQLAGERPSYDDALDELSERPPSDR